MLMPELLAIWIATLSVGTSFCILLFLLPKLIKKRYHTYACLVFILLGFFVYGSYIWCLKHGTHYDSVKTYETYPITHANMNSVYFRYDNNKEIQASYSESYVKLEEPNDNYDNVVVIETDKYKMKWLCYVDRTATTYHIYLTETAYDKLMNGDIIYDEERDKK